MAETMAKPVPESMAESIAESTVQPAIAVHPVAQRSFEGADSGPEFRRLRCPCRESLAPQLAAQSARSGGPVCGALGATLTGPFSAVSIIKNTKY